MNATRAAPLAPANPIVHKSGPARKAIEVVAVRKGEMVSMEPKGDRMILELTIPSRGIIGLRNYL